MDDQEHPPADVPAEEETVTPGEPDTEPAPPEADESPEAALQSRIAELENKLMRARADYDNLQRRVVRDAELERERAKARALEGFLEVYEYARMASDAAKDDVGPLAQGVRMVVGEFERLLQREGASTIGALGDRFDAALHEAINEEAAEGIEPGHLSRIIRPGYRLGERVLRYAKVAVAPHPGAADNDESA